MKSHASFDIILMSEDRDDGGVRVWSANLRGLHMSGRQPERVWGMIPSAVMYLLKRSAFPLPAPYR